MQRPVARATAALFAGVLLLSSSARASHFSFRRELRDGKDAGVVTSHGVDVFHITSTSGGFTPALRAQIIAERLESLAGWHSLRPEMFSVGYRNGEVIIQQQEHTEHLSHIVVTVDRGLARQCPGAAGSVERLAHWWLALLRDHASLAAGCPPIHTAGARVNNVFLKVFARLGKPTEPVASEEVDLAMSELSAEEMRVLRSSSCEVAGSFREDRVVVYLLPPGSKHDDQHEQAHPGEREARSVVVEPGKTTGKLSANKPVTGKHSEAVEHEKQEPGETKSAKRSQAGGKPEHPGEIESKPHEKPVSGNPSVRRVDRFKVTFTTHPEEPATRTETELRFKIIESSASTLETQTGAPGAAVSAATVRGWLGSAGSREPASPVKLHAGEEAGVYEFAHTFERPGRYLVRIAAITDDGDVLRAEFVLAVKTAPAEAKNPLPEPEVKPASNASPAKEPAPQSEKEKRETKPPPAEKRVAPRDRVSVRLIDTGELEIAWLQTEPPIKQVTFVLLNKSGTPIDSKNVHAAPFEARFKVSKDLDQIGIAVEFENGVQTRITVPYQPKP